MLSSCRAGLAVVLSAFFRVHFWLGVSGLAFIAWVVVKLVELPEEELRRAAPWWGLGLAGGAILSGFLPGALLGGRPWWVIWMAGMSLRLFAPFIALTIIMLQRPGEAAATVAIYTVVFYCGMLWVSLIPKLRRTRRTGKTLIPL